MLAAVRSAAVLGIDAYDVTVEVDCAQGLPQWTIVGLPAGAVRESRERVGSALVNSGFFVPPRRVTVNLAPADVPKTGTAFDLPIALGVLAATGQLPPDRIEALVVVGELGLDGSLRAIRGSLPIARHVAALRGSTLVAPPANAEEASLVGSLRLVAPETLYELVSQLKRSRLELASMSPAPLSAPAESLDYRDVVGQEGAKRALEIAAAGGHNVLLSGPPGAGKTMLARRLPSILPPLDEREALEVVAIHSVAGLVRGSVQVAAARPFRAPHHSVSVAGLIGGGTIPRPGEVSLAHHGVLFLDEMLEFPRHVLDAMRQPMEDGRVLIARAATAVSFPARFTLVGATNVCPCGKAGSNSANRCTCSTSDIARYQARLSGPLADRIDMHVTVGAIPPRELASVKGTECSAQICTRVESARALQRVRYADLNDVTTNAQVVSRWLEQHAPIGDAARDVMSAAAERLSLSARAYHRVLKVARTIADLDATETVGATHVAEALRYRPMARGD